MYSMGYFFNAIRRDISMIRGDTMSFAFQVKGLEGERPSEIFFTCKETPDSAEPLFVCQLGDTINERDYDSETDTLTYTVRVAPDMTVNLEVGRFYYDLEFKANTDVLTLMIGRFSIEPEITSGDTPVPPVVEDGDDIEYPIADIPLGQMKKYTEQYISDISSAIKVVNGSEDSYTVAQMSGAVMDIGDIISGLNERIEELIESYPQEIDNILFPTI